jgi:hypothetical protein
MFVVDFYAPHPACPSWYATFMRMVFKNAEAIRDFFRWCFVSSPTRAQSVEKAGTLKLFGAIMKGGAWARHESSETFIVGNLFVSSTHSSRRFAVFMSSDLESQVSRLAAKSKSKTDMAVESRATRDHGMFGFRYRLRTHFTLTGVID